VLGRLAVLALALVPALLASTADPAAAAWAVKGAGPARALAVTIPQGATPAATKATSAPSYLPVYTLTWSTTSLPAGQAVLGYQVRRTVFPRTAVARVEPISAGSCAGTTVSGLTNVYVPADPTARTQSCTDTNAYSTGEVTFTVTPVIGPWVGPTSPASPVYS
jgi:hypothetical protein